MAPVYPWIYTGGHGPYLWEPITGIETLNFKPYRVDLTPFAGAALGWEAAYGVRCRCSTRMAASIWPRTCCCIRGASSRDGKRRGDREDAHGGAPPKVEAVSEYGADGTVSGPVNVTSVVRAGRSPGTCMTSHGASGDDDPGYEQLQATAGREGLGCGVQAEDLTQEHREARADDDAFRNGDVDATVHDIAFRSS